jgi:hypothetical protein
MLRSSRPACCGRAAGGKRWMESWITTRGTGIESYDKSGARQWRRRRRRRQWHTPARPPARRWNPAAARRCWTAWRRCCSCCARRAAQTMAADVPTPGALHLLRRQRPGGAVPHEQDRALRVQHQGAGPAHAALQGHRRAPGPLARVRAHERLQRVHRADPHAQEGALPGARGRGGSCGLRWARVSTAALPAGAGGDAVLALQCPACCRWRRWPCTSPGPASAGRARSTG